MIRMMTAGAVDLSMTSILLLAIAVMLSHALLNIWDMNIISLMNEVSVWWSCGGLVVICAILASFTPQRNDVWWVLTDYENYTGFSSVSYVVMLSMVCAAYTLFGMSKSFIRSTYNVYYHIEFAPIVGRL
jgi:amino acid transporter